MSRLIFTSVRRELDDEGFRRSTSGGNIIWKTEQLLLHGLYRQGYVKFKDFSRTSKTTTTVFKDNKFMTHTEPEIKI